MHLPQIDHPLRTRSRGSRLARMAVGLLAVLLCGPTDARAQDGPPDALFALEQMLASEGDASLRTFVTRAADPELVRAHADDDALLASLRALREQVGEFGGVGLRPDGPDRVLMVLQGGGARTTVAVTLSPDSGRIVALELAGREEQEPLPEVTWDTLDDVLRAAEAEGFCGSVLAARDGEVLLEAGYGHADAEGDVPVTPDTLFAIGSTPIDFTHGAILLLDQQGKLSLSDPLTRWFDDVPDDKASITLEMLRTGRSGLYNFPGIQGVDENMDLSWIDRDEFMRRVFGSELRFPPGRGEAHSHAAWGVLAAVIELASGTEYHEFLRTRFFEAAGMERTGPYEFTRDFPVEEVAVGLGGNTWGEVNAPPWWGPTSWLVKGSGGMVSTPGDLHRWRTHLASGDVLGQRAQRIYGIGGVFLGEGGNDRGFINTLGMAGDDMVIVCSNAHVRMDDDVSRLAMAVASLGTGE